MNSDSFVFRGKPQDYRNYLKSVFFQNRSCFENVYSVLGNLEIEQVSKHEAEIILGKRGFIKVGQKVDLAQYPLQFRDGSIFTIQQTIRYEKGACWVKKSVICFAKLDASQRVQYLFHYDTVHDIPEHPDHHLQFEFNPQYLTPRFPLRAYEDVSTILHMIIRDKIAC